MRNRFMPVLVLLAGQLVAQEQGLRGTVLDPQHRLISGAKVELACGESAATERTNSQGQFTFPPRKDWRNCILQVMQQGFASYEQVLTGNPGLLRIELKLAEFKYSIDVNAEQDRLHQATQSTLGTISLSEDRLRTISDRTRNLIQYAEQLAGVTSRQEVVYVDGLPSRALPPAELIARISVNDDPFSAEYADGDQVRIGIATKTPDRKLRWHFGGVSFGTGEGSALDPGHLSATRSGSLGLTGPVPRTPLTFSVDGNLISVSNPEAIRAAALPLLQGTSVGPPSTVLARNTSGSILLSTHYAQSESMNASLAFYAGKSHASNLTAGGLTLPEAAFSSRAGVLEFRATLSKQRPGYFYQAGFIFGQTNSELRSNSEKLGLIVPGNFVAGGAAIADNTSIGSSWFLKNLIQTSALGRPLIAGIIISSANDSINERPNPAGLMEFENLQSYERALTGAPTGTWFVTQGDGRARTSSLAMAPFVQSELWRGKNAILNAGLRADYQEGGGLLCSPRLSVASLLRSFVLRAAAGMFVHNWPNDVFLTVAENDGSHLERLLVPNVSFAQFAAQPTNVQQQVVSKLAPDLTRPRNWMIKTSVEHPFGNFVPGVEYTWTDGLHQLGSQRFASGTGWVDLLESNRVLRQHQLHASMRLDWKKQSFVFHYEWIRSRDDTDGPFSFPANQKDVLAEWARSSGVSPHNLIMSGSFLLRGGVKLNVVNSWRSSAPYNITTGLDSAHMGLYNDRGGLPRNSGNSPAYNSLSLYGYRRVRLPKFLRASREKTYVDVGIQADNLLDHKNYLTVGSVLGSSLFGRSLAALPGRSFRLWFTVDQ